MKGFFAGLICLLILLQSKPLNAQTDSVCRLRISVLTCSPGDDLYSLFGHNALRIIDSIKRTDIIYNWGTFDFYDPDFYLKFMRGKLLYFLEPNKLPDFLQEYQYEGRSVIEQVLDLSCEEKMEIKKAVDINMIGDNRFYKYDFLLDNCTTRIRDILQKNIKNINEPVPLVPVATTFRDMIHAYLDQGSQPWSKLGIDILLGSKIDRPVTNTEAMFLPDFLMKGIDSAKVNSNSTVITKQLILDARPRTQMQGIYKPLMIIGAICLALFLISLFRTPAVMTFIRFSDTLLVSVTGLIGLLILFMWFFTDHWSCDNNYNIVWALPTNFIAAFATWKRPPWIRKYFKVAVVLIALLLITWFWLPQEMNIAIAPFCLYMFYRYAELSRSKKI
jgi:hypothetical protein